MMCYAVGMVAFSLNAAESVSAYTSMDFHLPALWGQTPRYGLNDSGIVGTQDAYYWCYLGLSGCNQSLMGDYGENEKRYDRFGAAGRPNPQPEYMKAGAANAGRLDFCCLDPLLRTFETVDSTGQSESLLITKNDLFVDTLVKFCPRVDSADAVPELDVNNSARFMCWLSSPTGANYTNLIVTAGHYDVEGFIHRTNYVMTNEVVAGRWYRLTARAIKNAATKEGTDNVVGFALYLDGRPVSCAAEDYSIGDDRGAMDELFAGNELYSSCSLFPPMRAFDETSPRLSGFAVQGRGWYDELGVVTKGNPLAYTTTEIDFTVAMSINAVTNVICTVTSATGTEPYQEIESSYEAEVTFKVHTGDKIHVEPKVDARYSLSPSLSLSGNLDAVATAKTSGYDVTMRGSFSNPSRLVARITTGNANFRVGDKVYESVVKAVEAADSEGKTLELENDVVLDPNMKDNGQMRILPKQELVLDLRGRSIRGENFREEATIYDQGVLTVIDSVGGGSITAPGTVIEVASSNDALNVNHELATLVLGDEFIRGDFTVTGRVTRLQGELVIKGGTYLTPFDLAEDPFYLSEYTADKNPLNDERCHSTYIGDRHWRVSYDDRLQVKFESEIGKATPAYTNIDLSVGKTLVEPQVSDTLGYSLTNWYVKGSAPRVSWNFAESEVESNMTLVAQYALDVYTITYDGYAGTPSSYTVKTPKTALQETTRERFVFRGWKDVATGHIVDFVGEGAVFADAPDVPVSGNLELISQWAPEPVVWRNTYSGNAESNGTYSGSWKFNTLPGFKLPENTKYVLDEIAFCIVNPLLYPKTAEYLAITNAAGVHISAKREYGYDPGTTEYVGNERLANGRVRVCYKFDGVEIVPNAPYGVCFTSSATSLVPTAGFLRLSYAPFANDLVFGNCTEAGGNPKSDDYLKYCPVYEVTGHLEDVK